MTKHNKQHKKRSRSRTPRETRYRRRGSTGSSHSHRSSKSHREYDDKGGPKTLLYMLLVIGVSIALGFGLWEASTYLIDLENPAPSIAGRNIIVLVGAESVAGYSPVDNFNSYINQLREPVPKQNTGIRGKPDSTTDLTVTMASEWGCEPRVGHANHGREFERDVSILKSFSFDWEDWPPEKLSRVVLRSRQLSSNVDSTKPQEAFNVSGLQSLRLGQGACKGAKCFGPEFSLGHSLNSFIAVEESTDDNKGEDGTKTLSYKNGLIILKVSATGSWWENSAEFQNHLYRAAKELTLDTLEAVPNSHVAAVVWVASEKEESYPHTFMRQVSDEPFVRDNDSLPLYLVVGTSSPLQSKPPLSVEMQEHHALIPVPQPCWNKLPKTVVPMLKLGDRIAHKLLKTSSITFKNRDRKTPTEGIQTGSSPPTQPGTNEPTDEIQEPGPGEVFNANIIILAGQSNAEGNARVTGLESISRFVSFIHDEQSKNTSGIPAERMSELLELVSDEILRPVTGRGVGCDNDLSLGDMNEARKVADFVSRQLVESEFKFDRDSIFATDPRFTISRAHFQAKCSEPCSPYTNPVEVRALEPGFGASLDESLFGPELFMAKSFANGLDQSLDPNRNIHIFKVAAGGSSLSNEWVHGKSLHSWFISETKRLLSMPGNKLAGVVWFQGISDAHEEGVTSYKENLESFISKTRLAFGTPTLPFLFVKPSTSRTLALKRIGEIQEEVASNDIASRTIETDGLSPCYHYDSGSMPLIGQRIAKMFMDWNGFSLD